MKNTRLRYLAITMLCFVFNTANAQQIKEETIKLYQTIPNYRIGDQIPDFGILKIINHTQPTINLNDYKKSLVILDFWGTGCGSCIEDMPRMDAVQKQIGDKVKILPVTAYQTKEQVQLFWTKNKLLKGLSLSSVVEDKMLSDYFKYQPLGLHVWIHKGKVIGLTSPEYVDAYNINQVLAGRIPNWPVWNDFYQFDVKQPLSRVDTAQIDAASTFMRYAQISDYKEFNDVAVQPGSGLYPYGIVRDEKTKTVRTYFMNAPIYQAYVRNMILSGIDFNKMITPAGMTPNVLVWEVSDKSKYIYEKQPGSYEGDWIRKNGICFESLNPDTGKSDQQVAQSVIKDLNRLLGLNVRWEKRKEKVLVLIRTTAENRLTRSVNKGAKDADRYIHTGNLYKYKNYPYIPIASEMNQQASNPYVFDETKYEGKVNMELNIPFWTDIPAIRKAIAPYGLALKEEERLVDKFVFTEVNGGLLVDADLIDEVKAKKEAQKDLPNPSPKDGKAFLAENKKFSGIISLPSGLQYKVIKQGTGPKPSLKEIVDLKYTSTLVNGKIFDSTDERGGQPFKFEVKNYDEKLLAGMVEGLQLMPVGSKYVFYIPAELAFGSHTHALERANRLPANSAVVFEVELLGIVK